MKQSWNEFKAFAMGGNMIDLAIGVIIGIAFGAVVDSFAKDVLMALVAAIFGQPSFESIAIKVNGGEIAVGSFLNTVVNFLLIAGTLFFVVKLLKRLKMGNFRAQGQRECPFCREFVAVDAVRCKFCTSNLSAVIDGDDGAEERATA